MDIFGTRWRIVEKRKYPHTKDLSTEWIVQHKFLGMFWTVFLMEYAGGNEFSEFYENFKTEGSAKKALLEKLGEKKFFKNLKAGKIEFIKLPPIEFGVRVVETQNPGMNGYVLKSGHYEDNGILFISHENVSEFSESAKEVLMKADLKGFRVDNRKRYDPNCIEEDRDSGVLII